MVSNPTRKLIPRKLFLIIHYNVKAWPGSASSIAVNPRIYSTKCCHSTNFKCLENSLATLDYMAMSATSSVLAHSHILVWCRTEITTRALIRIAMQWYLHKMDTIVGNSFLSNYIICFLLKLSILTVHNYNYK